MDFEKRFIEYIMSRYDESKKEFDYINKQVSLSDLNVNNRFIETLAVPKVYSPEELKLFEDFASSCFSVLNKVIDKYIDDANYRELFPFSKELEELILLPAQYSVHIPMARVDFFYNKENKDIKLCEINTDGASAMNENRIFFDLLRQTPAVNHVLGEDYYSFELFDTWVGEFMNLWNEYSNNKPNPTVAIIDFMDMATVNEFKRFREAFERNGINCFICDIRQLNYDGKSLSFEGQNIDAIYRRTVTSDIMKNYNDVKPFIAAVKDNNVCVVGGIKTQIIHNKVSFLVLHKEETMAFLSKEERAFVKRHVPVTKVLGELTVTEDDVYDNKDKWILKPFDLYASKGVYAGIDYSPEEWKSIVHKSIETGDYLMQEFYTPFRTDNIDFLEESPQVKSYCNMTGAFCYNEKVYGIYSRLSKDNIIIPKNNEKVVATVTLKD